MGGPMPTVKVDQEIQPFVDFGQDIMRSMSANANSAINDLYKSAGLGDLMDTPNKIEQGMDASLANTQYEAGAPERERIEKVTKFLNAYGRGRKKAPGRSQNLANQVDLLNASKNGGPLLGPMTPPTGGR